MTANGIAQRGELHVDIPECKGEATLRLMARRGRPAEEKELGQIAAMHARRQSRSTTTALSS